MRIFQNRFLQAVFLLAGTTIGVGMFALPYVFAKAGFFLGLGELLVLTLVTVAMNWFYGEVIVRTESRHLLPGFVKLYLGKRWFAVESASAFLGFSGGLFVYVLLGGVFLANLLGVEPAWGQFFFFLGGIALVFLNLKGEAEVNYVLTAVMIGFILILSGLAFRFFDPVHLTGFTPASLYTPYGVILFSLAGGAIIPEVVSFLKGERRRLRAALALGVIIPAIVYLFFVVAVLGATGGATTPDALGGLLPFIGKPLFFFGNAIGFLATFTSFILFGFTFRDILRSDFGMGKIISWFLFAGVTAVLFLLPLRNFVNIMGFVGAIAIGIDSIFVLWLYEKVRATRPAVPGYSFSVPRWAVVLFGVLFFLGFAAPFV
ncbi:MAG: hypothetical protein HY446_00315 [Candidatus Niyogibacteria bacterium]|nr:hypothetical protein [Candidatus Niyogibacteria bacterium]